VNPLIIEIRANENRIKDESVGGTPCQTRKTISQLKTVVISIDIIVLENVIYIPPLLKQALLKYRLSTLSPSGVISTLASPL